MSEQSQSLVNFSDALASAVERAGRYTVTVSARSRQPASGIGYDTDLVLTADHVIEREEDIAIVLGDGQKVSVIIAGRDPARDLALLRLAEPVLTPAERAGQEPRVGHIALAVARPDGGLQTSLGVISAIGGPVWVGRSAVLDRYVRSDAFPFPGFSGGPLVNASGQVLGINTSAMTGDSLLTIPADIAWEAAENLKAHGHIRRGYIGVRSQPVRLAPIQTEALGRSQTYGLLLMSIESDSPAAEAGLLAGDILAGIDNQPIEEHDQLQGFLSRQAPGKDIHLEILRGSQRQIISMRVGERQPGERKEGRRRM